MKNNQRPTDSELEILNILWTRGPATVRQVHEELSLIKPSQYTTTLKLMQIMADKGLLHRDETDRSHVYTPAVERTAAQQQMVAHLMDRAFGGSAHDLLLGALGAKRTSRKELADLKRLIEDHEKGKRS
jgi:BlaI family transcriptional regulator, penicillinase repressor